MCSLILVLILLSAQPMYVYGRGISSDKVNYNDDGHFIHNAGNNLPRKTTRMKRSGHNHVDILAYLRGKIYTVNTNNNDWHTDPKQAIVIKDGVIEFVGDNSMAEKLIYNYYSQGSRYNLKIFDLNGAVILPGIHDIHTHPLEAGSELGGTCTLPPDTPPDQMIDIIKECAPNQVGTEWVLGFGYSITSFLKYIEDGGIAPRKILDQAVPNKPAVMMEETSHSVWVNSEALRRANINQNTFPRPGGIIMTEHGSNEPNGMLFENEVMLIMDEALKPTPVLEQYNYDGLLYALGKLAENGITSVCDARLYTKRNHQKAWQTACDNGSLSVRAILGIWASPSEDDRTQIQHLQDMYSDGNPNCTMRITQIKFYSDGIAQSTTAAMLKPYLVNISLPGLEENIGMNYFDQARLETYLSALQTFDSTKHFDFNIHAIGDRGIHECLNAINSTFQTNTRHRITHVEILNKKDVNRFADLGVIADFQVAGNYSLPREKPDVEELIGKSRASLYIPVKTVSDAGGFTTFSSDWDVSDLNPFVGIQHATERGNESVSVKAAIEMYTINPAYAMRHENVVGSLVEGKEADLIVISQDILVVPNTNIKKTKVLLTVLQGESVYLRKGSVNTMKDVSRNYIDDYCPNNKCVYIQTPSSGSQLCAFYPSIIVMICLFYPAMLHFVS